MCCIISLYFLRITPCLAVLLLFVVVLFPRFGSGATWETAKSLLVDPCREKWWINLLYLQNIVSPDPIVSWLMISVTFLPYVKEYHDPQSIKTTLLQCMVHSWYLALDMQLFWLSPLILYPLHRKPKIGLWLLGVFLVIALVTPAYVLAANGYSNVVLRLDTEWVSDSVKVYMTAVLLYYELSFVIS